MREWLRNVGDFLGDHLLPSEVCLAIGGVVCGIWLGMQAVDTSDKQPASSQSAYAQEIIKVGDVKWLCLTNDSKPISCQLISPLTDDKLNNYKHINVQG